MRDNNHDVNDKFRFDAGSGAPLDDARAGVVFDDPIAYLASFGIEASIVAESIDRLRDAA